MAFPAMEDETDLLDLDQLAEPVSSDGDSEGSGSEASEAEPKPAAVGHGYNLRPKRTGTGASAAPAPNKTNAIAPGMGVEADNDRVGGRDAGDATKRRVVDGDPPNMAVRKAGLTPKSTDARPPGTREARDKVVDRSGGVAWDIPILRAEGRSKRTNDDTERRSATARRRDQGLDGDPTERDQPRDLSPQSGEEPSWEDWDAFRRARLAERLRKVPLSGGFLPTNEFARPGNSSRPSVAGRNAKSRLEPRATDLLERSAPVEPGRGRKFDIMLIIMLIMLIPSTPSLFVTLC